MVAYTKKEKQELAQSIENAKCYTKKGGIKSVYSQADSHIFVRDESRRSDYGSYGDDDDLEVDTRKNIVLSMLAYKKVGIIRNVVDLGGDFAAKGVRFVNKNKNDQKFLEEWAKQVNLQHVCERFCNMLLRCSNLIVQRSYAKIGKLQRKKIQKGLAVSEEGPGKNRIPISYAINSPLNITVLNNAELSMYSGKPNYGYIIPPSIISGYKKNNAFIDLDILPEAIAEGIKNGEKNIPIDPDKTKLYFYKKDDWDFWAEPICSTILDDVQIMEKGKAAHMACLDGIASGHIRVWKHGNPELKIIPDQATIDKFLGLVRDGGNGHKDVSWNFAIDLLETGTEQYKFLESTKYEDARRTVYEGLGVPYVITGTDSSVNSSLSLKVMIERLVYVRSVLVQFLRDELQEVEKAMDLRPGTEILFDHINLTDETAEKALYLQMIDRNVVSIETFQRRFGENPNVELIQQVREQREIESGKRNAPLGQWRVDKEYDMSKTALQTGQATPSQVGLELKPNKNGEKKMMDLKGVPSEKKPRGQVGQGRPKNSSDKVKRTRTTKAFIQEIARAKKLYNEIAEVFTPVYLEYTGKKNVRSLSEAEWEYGEMAKFAALCSSKGRSAEEVLADEHISVPSVIMNEYKSMLSEEMTTDERRDLMIGVFSKHNLIGDNDG